MSSLHTSRFRPQVLLIFLVALGLLFAGARVPDISRPHRPKPSQRVVLEKQHKSCSDQLKLCGDVVAALPDAPKFSAPISFQAEPQFVSPRYASHLFIPNSGRSPPAALS